MSPSLKSFTHSMPAICDGIGLVRTEFLFHSGEGLPNEERQYAVYARSPPGQPGGR